MEENTRILQCRDIIIKALNKAQIPLAVSALILENVQMQIRLQMQAQKEEGPDGEPNKA